jgi:hypothetical protein
MNRICYCCIITFSMILGSCQHENMQVYPDEFKPYVDEFFIQANLHGRSMDATQYTFSIKFGDLGDEVGAFCFFIGNAITVDREGWEDWDHFEKERIIFHELGHCLLNRNHYNAETISNECYSYMNKGDGCSFNPLSVFWRDYFMEELFNESTTLPEWYLTNRDYAQTSMPFRDSVVIKDTIPEYELEMETFGFNQQDTFLFEIEFNNAMTLETSVSFRLGNLRFTHCDVCADSKTRLQIGNTSIYSSNNFILKTNIKFSVFRTNDVVSFYINGYFVHAMEYSLIEGNRIITKWFEDPMGLSIRYLFN